MDLIDNRTQVVRLKQMAGTSIVQQLYFFDISNPNVTGAKDITIYNIRLVGNLQGSKVVIANSIFDSAVNTLPSSGNRSGLFWDGVLNNKLTLIHDFMEDADNYFSAPEGVFEFRLIITDTDGIDFCPLIIIADCKYDNYIDDLTPSQDGNIHIDWKPIFFTNYIYIKTLT